MRNNVSEPLDQVCAGRVLPERNMRSRLVILVIIEGVFRKDSPKTLRVEYNQMISALAPDRPMKRSAYPFCQDERNEVGRSRMPIARSRALNCSPNALSLSRMRYLGAVSHRECFGDLARQPLRRRLWGHRKPQQLPPSMVKNNKGE